MNWKSDLVLAGIILASWSGFAAPLPAETNIFITPGAWFKVPGDLWKYHNQGFSLGTAWREADYDDSTWPEGYTQLGYGDEDEVTPIDIGPDGGRYMTIYFRHAFTVENASCYTNLTLRLLRDDGGVVYLNGLEVFRSNLPTNVITFDTPASSSVPAGDESTNFYARSFFPTNRVDGSNVVAVEIHQNAASSSDLSFDLALIGISVPTQGLPYFITSPANVNVMVGSNVSLKVFAAGALPFTYQWRKNGTNMDGANTTTLMLKNAQVSDSGIYSCIVSNPLGFAISSNGTLLVKPPPDFDLAKGFSSESNPAGPWAYGYQTNLGDTFVPFAFFTQQTMEGGALIDVWANNALDPARISRNGSSLTGTSDGGQGTYPPGTIWFEPGVEGHSDNYGVVRFTVPEEYPGTYEVAATVQSYLQGPAAGDTDFHILKNGQEFFCRYLFGTNYSINFSNNYVLTGGDVVDFVVGRGADGKIAGSGLKINASLNLAGTNPVGPIILVQPASQVGTVGSNITFSVLAQSTLPINYQWHFNGADISGAVSPTLVLSNLQYSDAGTYSVTVWNSSGTVLPYTAALAIKPQALYDLARDFSWNSNPKGSWSYGWISSLGSPLNLFTASNAFVSQNGVLFRSWGKITNEPASINYNPTASLGSTNNGLNLYPPGTVWIVPGLEGHTDNLGVARVRLPFKGDGYYELQSILQPYLVGDPSFDNEFRISRNGVEIFRAMLPPNTGMTYSNVIWMNRLDWIDLAVGRGADRRNAGSGLKIEATLTPVSVSPLPLTILGYPQSQITAVGSNVVFLVAANGAGPFRFQWGFDGTNIDRATNGGLALNNVTASQAGLYQVTVTDSLGATVMAQAKLTVLDFKDGMADDFDPDYDPLVWSALGGTVLANTNGGCVSGPNSFWFGGSGSRFATTRALDTSLGGAVTFYIRLANTYYSFWDRPELTNEMVVLEYSINNGSTWTIFSRYDTTNFMTWGLQVVPIPSAAQSSNTFFRWRQLSNSGATSDHWALDNVQIFFGSFAPVILLQPTNQVVLEGGNVSLRVTAISSGPLFFQWQQNGQDLPGQNSFTLDLNGVSANQSGFYTVLISNALGAITSDAALVDVVNLGEPFQIVSLSTNNFYEVEHGPLTGSDRSGIALSDREVFINGYTSAARFRLGDLSEGAALGRIYDGLVSDLRTGKAYCLANGTNLPTAYYSMTLTTLQELDAETGNLTGHSVSLSMPIALPSSSVGLFSGYGRIVIHTGSRVYHILMPSGLVLDMGAMSSFSHAYSGTWAYWGVAEYFGGSVYLVYAQDYQNIVRARVPDGLIATVATFANLSSYMAAISVSPYLDRWYWHHRYSSQFGNGNDMVGYANATFAFNPDPVAPWIVAQPKSQPAIERGGVTLNVIPAGAHPFSYQWLLNDKEIPDATNAILSLSGLTASDSGLYAVRVSNAYGAITSSNALLTVVGWGEQFQITSLTSDNAFTIEHGDLTGSDVGGIAASDSKIFYSGYTATASFNLDDLSGGTSLGRTYYAQVSNLRTEMAYSLGNGTNLITSTYNAIVTTLLEHDPLSGDWTGNRINLTAPIPLSNYNYIGLFSGFDRIVIHNYTRAYMILLPYGLVVDLGAMPAPLHAYAPNYFYWGVAEYFNHAVSLVCVRDSRSILRTRVPDGSTNVVAAFTNLSSSMFAITVSPYLNRWYFHHQNNSQFRSGGNQTLGFADATFSYTDAPRPAVIVSHPASQGVSAGSTVKLTVSAVGARPLSYQWRFNGQDIPEATSATFYLEKISVDQAGNYSVVVSNVYGTATSTNATLLVNTLAGNYFQISSLTTNNVYVVEHSQYTGDNRGAIAASSSKIFYSGDSATTPFGLGDLSAGTNLACCYDGLVSDLRTERMYSLANGTNRIANGGGTITSLLEHDPATGQLNGNRIDLSMPITVTGPSSSSTVGIFAGYERIVLHTGSVVYNIDLPSGTVSEIGRMAPLTHIASENWGYWGVAEFLDGAVSLVYVRDATTIARTRVPDGLTKPAAAFSNLGTMSAFTVSIYLNRWYFHHTYNSQFRSGDETLGFGDATFGLKALPLAPQFVGQPSAESVSSGSQVSLYSIAKGSEPLSYQWLFEGVPIEGANSPVLTLAGVSTQQAGRYSVLANNEFGVAVSDEAMLNVIALPGEPFQIIELSTNNCYVIECSPFTGDGRGPMAISSNQVFYTGDSGTARFGLLDLAGGANVGSTNDALVSDLQSGLVYSLANGSNPLPNGGGTVSVLLEHDPQTGALTGNAIFLSRPIVLSGTTYGGYIGIFAGYGRIVVHDMSRVYDIALPSGMVTELGTMPPPMRMSTECWAYWGVAEFVDGVIYLVYVRDSYTIARTRVPDGLTTPVATFNYLGYNLSITVSPFTDRWYFHHAGYSQFRSGGDETMGFADAALSCTNPFRPPAIAVQPANANLLPANTARFQVLAVGSRPLVYQWQCNGQDIPDATNSILTLTNVMPAQAGLYSATISNASGWVASQPAVLKVWESLPIEKNFRITFLSSNNVAVVDDRNISGYERGGIGVSPTKAFHTGDSYTGRFQAADLSGGTNLNARYDGLVSDLRSEQVYVLAYGTNLLPYGGGMVDTLWALDSETGGLTTNRIALSMPISLGYYSGLFSGYGCIVLYSYSQNRTYLIDLPSGDVVDLGATYLYNYPYSGWASWGVAEQFNDVIYLVYVADTRTIVRARVPDLSRTNLAVFTNLGYMSGFTLSTSRGRWYFHTDGASQFSTFSETLGFADATWDYPPSISFIPTQNILEDTDTGPIPFHLSDMQTPAEDLLLSASSSDTNLVPNANISLQGSGTNRFVTVVPSPNLYGSVTITLTATDGGGATGSRSFKINVAAVNDPPSFDLSASELVILEDATTQQVLGLVTNISAGAGNERQALSYLVTNDNPQLFSFQPSIYNVPIPLPGDPGPFWLVPQLSYTPAPDAFGTATVTVLLQDSGGTNDGGIDTSAPRQFTITILPVNDAPSFELSGTELTVFEDAGPQIVVDWATGITAGPANESDQTVAFALTSDNPGLFASSPAINSAGTLTFLATTHAYGVATVTAILRDNGGTNNGGIDTSAPRQFAIRVQHVNHPPAALAQSVTLNENTTAAITLAGSDLDGDSLAYDVVAGPAHGTLSGTPPNLVYHPATNYAGADSFSFHVSDGQAWSAPATVSLNVLSLNHAPVAVAGISSPSMLRSNETGFVIMSLNGSNAVVVFDGSLSTDQDNDPLTYYWWEEGASNCFAVGICVTNLVEAGDWRMVLGVSDGTALGSNTVHVQIITPSEAVEALLLQVNAAPIARQDKKFLVNKLKEALKEFEKGHSHPALNHLREFVRKVEEISPANPDLAESLVQAAEQIIYSFAGSELTTAHEELERLFQQVNEANLARQDQKALVDKLKEALDEFEKGHWQGAAAHLQQFQKKVQDRITRINPILAGQLSTSAQDILNILEEYQKKGKDTQ